MLSTVDCFDVNWVIGINEVKLVIVVQWGNWDKIW